MNIWGRVSISLTGRPTWRAAMAVSVTLGHTIAFMPNEPPTNGASTRTCDSGSPSRWATVSWVARTPMVDSWIVSLPSSQAATVDGASIGLWWLAAIRRATSTRTSASSSAASTSPRSLRPGISPPNSFSASYACSRPSSIVTTDGARSYSVRTSDAACCARSCESATTSATGWPA